MGEKDAWHTGIAWGGRGYLLLRRLLRLHSPQNPFAGHQESERVSENDADGYGQAC
jgi:hypothetical protein